MADWMEPFARTIDAAKKHVVSSTLNRVDWNAEPVHGDHLEKAVQQLKRESGKGLFVGGMKLPLALAELGLIDEYEFVVQPRLAGHGPTLFAEVFVVPNWGHPCRLVAAGEQTPQAAAAWREHELASRIPIPPASAFGVAW